MRLLRATERDVDCLPLAKSKLQSAIRRSAAFWKPPRGGRSLAVFFEGVDSGPSDPGKAPEACEIGGTRMPSGEPSKPLTWAER